MVAEQNGKEPVVAVLGHYGNRNLGDESIVTAVLAGLRRSIPGVEAIAVSMDPVDSARRHGVAAYPVRRGARSPAVEDPVGIGAPEPLAPAEVVPAPGRRHLVGSAARLLQPFRGLGRWLRDGAREIVFLGRVWCFARGVDLVLISGSSQVVDDFGGPRGYPWTIFKWSLMARLAGARVAFLSVGAGPLSRRSSHLLARMALGLADYVSWRDEASRALVERARPCWRGHVYPDPAFGLVVEPGARADEVRSIGINPMPVYDGRYWPDAQADRYARYVAIMAETIARLRGLGWAPFLYAMQPADGRVIEDISAALHETGAGELVEIHAPTDLDELETTLKRADLLIATRYHGVVLGLLCGRPVVSICHHRKIADLAEGVGLGAFAIDLDALEVDGLVERVTALAACTPAIHAEIDNAVAGKRIEVEEQFARIAHLAGRRRRPSSAAHAAETSARR